MRYGILLLLFLLVPAAQATTYHTTLLTVSDEWNGGVADAYLEIEPGSGRIFMDSYPITKTDTQFSTRFANQVACDFLRVDCSRYDFFYTIRAETTIVGGPSAGAAMTILTIAALDKQPLRQDVAMTGTINSGGVVGPVAGVVPKALAGKNDGMTIVVVPALVTLGLDGRNVTNASLANTSSAYDEFVLQNLSDENFEVVRAGDLYDALPYFIDKKYPPPQQELKIPESYADIMRQVEEVLCERRQSLLQKTRSSETNRSREIDANIVDALSREEYYSAASYCFTQNIELQEVALEELRPAALRVRLENTKRELELIDAMLEEENLTTIGDVETRAIVRERSVEAQKALSDLNESDLGQIAFIIERTNSAKVWSEFFAMESAAYDIDKEHLRDGCIRKLSEAEERVSYIESFLPDTFTEGSREELNLAHADRNSEEYSLCLFKASKAKAQANAMTSVVAVSEDRVDLLVEQKLAAVERVLSRQAEQNLFPIMGYSYYEYAMSLADDQPYSALTFAEYSLELSNLHVFFPREDGVHLPAIDWYSLGVFLFGVLIGFVASRMRR